MGPFLGRAVLRIIPVIFPYNISTQICFFKYVGILKIRFPEFTGISKEVAEKEFVEKGGE